VGSSGVDFDVIVIGAGINGAGCAHDAARRGLSVLLIDKGDVGSGTTSASTRLIHGGLRYLEHGELGLVRESLHERERLLRLAPHLVHRLEMLIPFYRKGRRRRSTIIAGLYLYDVLSAGSKRPRHKVLSRDEATARIPALSQAGLIGGALYADAQVEFPERLAFENALAAVEHGAELRTYTRVDRIVVENGAVRGVEFTDAITGETGLSRSKVIVNAAGPWVDEVLGRSESPDRPRLIGGTLGSHISVERFQGAPSVAVYAEAEEDGRPFFVIPWNGILLIGTTDVPYAGDPDQVAVSAADMTYLISSTNRLFPVPALTPGDVLYTWCGVRPLPYAPGKGAAGITRRHVVHDHAPVTEGLISLIGGKLTTYRHFSEIAVDLVIRKLGRRAPSTTASAFLPGSEMDPAKVLRAVEGCAELRAAAPRLVRTYGSRSLEIVKAVQSQPELARPLTHDGAVTAAEIAFCVEREHPRTLGDVLLRRTMVGLDPRTTAEDAAAIAREVAAISGWDAKRLEAELSSYLAEHDSHRGGYPRGEVMVS
jgi:glycerol-3-phosphate dehydrogenase